MRLAGRISDWNDDKGFGFVVPHDGGVRAFVHVKAFPFGSRRPVDGDLISYAASTDARGRTNASDVRFAGQRIAQRREPGRAVPRRAMGVVFLLGVISAALPGVVPAVIAIAYLGLSGMSWLWYRADKHAAGKGAQRTPESTLHLVDLLGGWPGGLIAQQQFRHKTVKASFQSVFWVTVVVNLGFAAGIMYSGAADGIAGVLLPGG